MKTQQIKKISIILLLSIALNLINNSAVFALKKSDSARILDNYKDSQKEMIFNSNYGLNEEDLEVFKKAEKVRVYDFIKDRMEDKTEDTKKTLQYYSDKKLTLEGLLEQLDWDIEDKKVQITKMNVKIGSLLSNITKTKKEITEIEEKILENRKVLLDYMVGVYKTQNTIYEDGKVDALKMILLDWWNIWDILTDYNFKNLLETTGNKLIAKHRDYTVELVEKKWQLWKQINQTRKNKRETELTKKTLEEKRQTKEKLLKLTWGREALFKKYVKEQIKKEREMRIKYLTAKLSFDKVQDELAIKYECPNLFRVNTEAITNVSDKCISLERIIRNESKLKDSKEHVQLEWPIMPEYGLSSYYRDKQYLNRFGSTHDAIDIVAPQWTEIKAPADAYVLYVKPAKDESYSFVALKHADWLVTVYGHLSKSLVSQYDFVKKWQVFAYSWGEPLSKWAGLMTTWAHLHFEVLKDEVAKDPLTYLDLTVLKLEQIPHSKYIYKYYDDFKKRFWDEDLPESNLVFNIDWESEIERQKNFIRIYWANGFNNWNIWVEEAQEAHIDSSFVMCVWLAETWLWTRLKTRNNVWNVWNTDSWATKEFDSPRLWIYWMAMTFNNKFLKNHNTISSLSRYWNSDGTIYASSSANWHNNIIKCMSSLKGEYVPDDYNFRTK